jgi:hypothetical protein
MAVLGRVLVSSAERLDLPDFLSIDSYTQGDFKYLIKSFVGSDKAYVLKGFEVINPNAAIDTQNLSINVANSVVYYPDSKAGPFFYGLEDGNPKAAPLVPELRKNAINYVYLVLSTSESAKDSRAFWDPDREGGVGGEFNQDVSTESFLSVEVNVSVSGFPDNVVPVCKVTVGTSVISSIEDCRNLMFRLGSGGISPNPLSRFEFREQPLAQYKRSEPNTKMTKYDPNSFRGGDKNIYTLKEWMDAVMTRLLELGGTTYWYQDQSSYSLVNIFKDALATSIKSKGTWANSDVTPGLLTWTEDIILQSMTDKRDIVIRAGDATLGDGQVMLIKQQRNIPINSGSVSADWIQGVNYINAQDNGQGTFENLSKGDWIKKAGDPDYRFRRVERFWIGQEKSVGLTSDAAIAQCVELSEPYEGLSELSQGIFSKGEYSNVDIQVLDRDDPMLYDAGGDLCWLATRADRILNISDIVSTELIIDISDHDGQKAKCTSVAHNLSDKQRIYIASPSLFEGEYQIEVESEDIFYIMNSSSSLADEVGQSAYFATVTTAANYSSPGLFLLESENHGFDVNHNISVTGSSAGYNNTYKVFPKTSTEFTIPVTSLLPSESFTSDPAKVTSVEIYVRTDIGPTKIEQGEIKQIGKVDSQNIMSFIGMENSAMMKPVYSVEPFYNTIFGQENYNSSSADNLTQRVSKLSAMMADKAQDKTITYDLQNVYAIVNTQNGSYRDIAAFAKAGTIPKLLFIQPSTEYKVEITLSGTISLLENQVAYLQLNRNGNTLISNLNSLIITDTDKLPLSENIFIFAIRGPGGSVLLWDKTPVRNYSTILDEAEVQVTTITLPSSSSISSGQYFNINSALDTNKYYVWFNKNSGGLDPFVIGKIGIEVQVSTGDSNASIAAALNSAINAIASSDMSSIDNLDGTVTITNNIAGFCTDASNVDVGGSFSVFINQVGTGAQLNFVSDGDLLETSIKKLDEKLAELSQSIPKKAYEETITITSGPTTGLSEVNELDAVSGSELQIPLDSRNSNLVKSYTVNSGQLEVFLNGQYLTLDQDWEQVGASQEESIKIKLLRDMQDGDVLLVRIDNTSFSGSGGGGGSYGEANTASNVGGGFSLFKNKIGVDLKFRTLVAGAGVSISQSSDVVSISSTPTASLLSVVTINGTNYNILPSNDVILVSNLGMLVSVYLPSAAANPGKRFDIKKVDSGSIVRIRGQSGDTLDDVNLFTSSIDISIQYESVTVVSNGVAWFII